MKAVQIYTYKEYKDELIVHFHLIRHGPHGKRCLQQFFVAAGTSLPSCHLATIHGYIGRPTDTRPTIFLLLRVCIAAGTCLPSRCLATIGGIQFTEPVPSKNRRDTLSRAVA
jgi:hypothetical protein